MYVADAQIRFVCHEIDDVVLTATALSRPAYPSWTENLSLIRKCTVREVEPMR
jgi:hypothetical protein